MAETFEGHYPIESRIGEIERLLDQGTAMAPDTETMLDLMGLAEGWHCLDIGCGPRGITDILSRGVGPTGRVVGLDMNKGFIDYARKSAALNTEFIQSDAYGSGLSADSFDFVHMRFLASTAGDAEALLKEAIRLARPGGFIALQEPDATSLNCYPPHESWETLKAALLGAFKGVGADLELARRLYFMVKQSPVRDVQFRPFIVGVTSSDAMVDYLPSTVESLRGTILNQKLLGEEELDRALRECRAHLALPDTSFTMYTVAQVWGRK
ncbi:MAG: methyltransferase domain-containing protein [Alphaproteobacteria bacterium]|nr:methyltransferase domain-containing protein [Alphaproteobacteria bacterium]